MSLEYFEGPAGSGKTYRLMGALEDSFTNRPIEPHEAVLGLTYMHGSRRRMHSALAKVTAVQGRFHACTVDSLARTLVFRWRTLAQKCEPDCDPLKLDFAGVCRVAATLIAKPEVLGWMARRYPWIVADELQDCRGHHLAIVAALESKCHVVAAADEFQDLRFTGSNEAVDWLHSSSGKCTVLTGNHRTSQPLLLKAAHQLRASEDCGITLGAHLMAAYNANTAAACVARMLARKGTRDIAILTPTGPDRSRFVRDVIARLTLKSITPKGLDRPVGPFRVMWEAGGEEQKLELLNSLGNVAPGITLSRLRHLCANDVGAGRDLCTWAEKRFSIRGQVEFTDADISASIERIVQARNAYLPPPSTKTIRAMTINQAKNREFEGVVILWPFVVGGDLASQRRRLYNALTRAKNWAIVVVQENVTGPFRIATSPFSKPASADARATPNNAKRRATKIVATGR